MNDKLLVKSNEEPDISIGNRVKTKDIARNLKKPESTIRKYSQDLEKNGYKFTKDPNGTRFFNPQDEAAMLEYIRYREEMNMSVHLAARSVVTRREQATSDLSPDNTKPSTDISVPNIQQVIQHLSELPSKEQFNYLIESVEKVMDLYGEEKKKNIDTEKENEILKEQLKSSNEKLSTAVDVILRVENKIDNLEKTKEKKGLFGKWFGWIPFSERPFFTSKYLLKYKYYKKIKKYYKN